VWGIWIFTFGAKEAINPTIFMAYKAHVVNVDIRNICLGQNDWMIPEAEAIYTIITFSHSKKRFTVIAFNTGHEIEFTV
jgi:hypothetical protein